jgi:DNA repair protein RadC
MPITNQQQDQRRIKLKEIIALIEQRPRFRRQEIQFLCREAKPAFVTKVLNQLYHDGLLQRELFAGEACYVWSDKLPSLEHWIDRQIVGDQVTQLPSDERPRERLLNVGAAELTNSELLAILIRSGRKGESAVQAGKRLSQRFSDRLMDLPKSSPMELKEFSSVISETAYCQIMAGIELGRRVARTINERTPRPKINSTAAAIEFCKNHFERLASDALQEEFHIVTLDTKLQPIQSHQITVGTLDASLVHPREVFKPAIKDSAAAILLVHNHPSGDPTPSRQDREITERLMKSGDVLGIQVIDHVIVAKQAIVSLAEC